MYPEKLRKFYNSVKFNARFVRARYLRQLIQFQKIFGLLLAADLQLKARTENVLK